MLKIFYDPESLEIKGFSDGDNSMEFPYLKIQGPLYSTQNLIVTLDDGVPTLHYKQGSYTDEEWDRLINGT